MKSLESAEGWERDMLANVNIDFDITHINLNISSNSPRNNARGGR